MKVISSLVILSCALLVQAYPYNPYYGNVDSLSYGSSDSNRGGLVMSRYYNPYYNPRAVTGSMAFMYRQPEAVQGPTSGQIYVPDRRRQTLADTSYVPQQENEVYYPQQPENPIFSPTQATELADPTEKIELLPTTVVPIAKATEVPAAPEVPEPEVLEVEEPAPKSKKVSTKRKQVKKPVEDDDEEDEFAPPRVPTSAFFPMFFGWGGRAGGGPGGPTAVANAYSTGRGGVATSHATAYGGPRPDEKL